MKRIHGIFDDWWDEPRGVLGTLGSKSKIPFYLQTVGLTVADVIAAYKPLNATSLANSKINLAHPGTNDAFSDAGTDPSLSNPALGWVFSGGKYLRTGIVPVLRTTSIVMSVGNAGVNPPAAQTELPALGGTWGILAASGATLWMNDGYYKQSPDVTYPCVLAISNSHIYVNGIDVGTVPAGGPGPNTLELAIGARNNNGVFGNTANWNCLAVAIYNKHLTPTQVSELSAAILFP